MAALPGPSLKLDAVVLFGSRARGEAFEAGDVDIALLSDEFRPEEPMLRRLERIEALLAAFQGFDPVCLSPSGKERLDHLLILGVLHDGTFQRLRALFEEALAEGRVVPFDGGGGARV